MFAALALIAGLGVMLVVAERKTGRGRIIDERRPRPQTEADGERMRGEGAAFGGHNMPNGSTDSGDH